LGISAAVIVGGAKNIVGGACMPEVDGFASSSDIVLLFVKDDDRRDLFELVRLRRICSVDQP
jgi:hypothetical protein